MKIIVGLGNPGIKYVNNRHNVGHVVIDRIKNEELRNKKFKASKSDRFMNDSGSFIRHLISLYPNISISDLYIIHDDLDIPLGSFKIQFGKGPKGHNGILDIEEKLGSNEFWRVRVGVDNRLQVTGDRLQGEQYVLQNFSDDEKKILEPVIKKICFELINKLKIEN